MHLNAYRLDSVYYASVVSAANVNDACRLFACGRGYFREYGWRLKSGEAGSAEALARPGVVLRRRLFRPRPDGWQEAPVHAAAP
jgi:hypothetical protein